MVVYVVSKVCKERVEAVNLRVVVLACLHACLHHVFLEIPGAERMRNALSLFLLLYTNSTTTSISFTAAPLKCLRTFVASCSLETRLLSFRLAIVGDCRPIPGFTRRAWLSGDVKAAGVERLCETRYVFSSDNGVVLQAIPGACAVLSASALAAASSFNALPLSLAAAAATAAAFCLLFLACAAAAICRSRTVDASERESSVTTVFFAGGIAAGFLSLLN